MRCFEIPVILVLLWYTSLCASQVTLELCDAPIKDDTCVLQCLTPDLAQSVVFKKDNTEYASCKFILGTLSCTSIYPTRSLISQQSSPAITSLTITQLSRAGDQGSWTCDYGSTGSSAHTLTVLTAPTQKSNSGEVNIDYCTGNKSGIYDVTLTVTCSSGVSVSAELSSSKTGITHTESLAVTKGAACSDVAENIYTAVYRITSTTGGLTGSAYILTLKTQLSGGIGETHEDVFVNKITFSCTPCTCIVTIVLGAVLGLPFTPLCTLVVWFALLKKKGKSEEISSSGSLGPQRNQNGKETGNRKGNENEKRIRSCCCHTDVCSTFGRCIALVACYWYLTIACTLVSCGLGAGFTVLAMDQHDKGDEETGCSCIEYSGVLLSLLFSIVMTVVYFHLLLCWKHFRIETKLTRFFFDLRQGCKNKCKCSVSPAEGHDTVEPLENVKEEPQKNGGEKKSRHTKVEPIKHIKAKLSKATLNSSTTPNRPLPPIPKSD